PLHEGQRAQAAQGRAVGAAAVGGGAGGSRQFFREQVRLLADVLRREAQLSATREDGTTQRAHYEAAAKAGSLVAKEALQVPERPDSVAYLEPWVAELHGRSGASLNGLALLSYSTIRDWAALTGRDPTPLEVEALLLLDGSLCFPDAESE